MIRRIFIVVAVAAGALVGALVSRGDALATLASAAVLGRVGAFAFPRSEESDADDVLTMVFFCGDPE